MNADNIIDFIEELDSYELGEYKDEFIQKAYDSALRVLGDPEENTGIIMDYMCEYIEGASDMYKKMKGIK